MTRLYIARHGETDWNVREIFRGRADIPLNAAGISQAARLGRELAEKPLTAVLTSPMQRAHQTASAVGEAHGLAPVVTGELIDIDFGDWQGLSRTEVGRRWPELYRAWQKQPETVQLPGGEALADVRRRLEPLLERLTESAGSVALVTHRVVAKMLILMLSGLPDADFPKLKLDTGAVTEFELTARGWVPGGHNLGGQSGAMDF